MKKKIENIISMVFILDDLSKNDYKKYDFLLRNQHYEIKFYSNIASLFSDISNLTKVIIINTDSEYVKNSKIFVLEFILKIRIYFPDSKVLLIGKNKLIDTFHDASMVMNIGGNNKSLRNAI